MIYILYTLVPSKKYEGEFDEIKDYLPMTEKVKIEKYVRDKDKFACLMGKKLLNKGLKKFGMNEDLLQNLCYNKYNRPYIPNSIDFNISHSGKYVILAICDNKRVGIDIEEIKEINVETFKKVITPESFYKIKSSKNTFKEFFRYWTKLESILKASGSGFVSHKIGLKLSLSGNSLIYNDQKWYINEINIDKNYCSCLATDYAKSKIYVEEIKF